MTIDSCHIHAADNRPSLMRLLQTANVRVNMDYHNRDNQELQPSQFCILPAVALQAVSDSSSREPASMTESALVHWLATPAGLCHPDPIPDVSSPTLPYAVCSPSWAGTPSRSWLLLHGRKPRIPSQLSSSLRPRHLAGPGSGAPARAAKSPVIPATDPLKRLLCRTPTRAAPSRRCGPPPGHLP